MTDVTEYDVARSLDSQYSSHQVPGGITPQYDSPVAHTVLVAATSARLHTAEYAEQLRQARHKAEARHRHAKDHKYLLLANARWKRLNETPPIPRIDGSTHRCVSSCEGIESTVEPDLWVCVASGNTHRCGSKCNLYIAASNIGRVVDVCPLSGVLASGPYIADDANDYTEEDAKFSGRFSIERSLNPTFRRALGLANFSDALEGDGDRPKFDVDGGKDAEDDHDTSDDAKKMKPSREEKSLSMLDALLKTRAPPSPAQQRETLRKQMISENRLLTTTARNVMHRLIFSERRRALDEMIISKAYDKLAQEFAKHYETRRKADLPPDCDFLVNRLIETSDSLKLRGGNVRYGQTLGAIETQQLLEKLARLSVALWRAFERNDAWHLGKEEPHRHPTIEYHTLAVLYASKDGVEMPLTKSRWLTRVPELQRLLPNEKDFGQLGFKKAEYSKNETFFRGALSNFFSREHVSM